MSSNVPRLALLSGLAIVLAGVIAWAQEHHPGEAVGRDAVSVFNVVEDRTVVITCLPEGARVEKGDVVCELDPSELKDRLAAQEIAVRAAEAGVNATRIAREVAVMAALEFKEGEFRHELAATQVEIKLSEANLASAEDLVDWARRMFEKGYVTMAEKVSDELALKKARFALEKAQSKKQVLIDHTRPRKLKSLTGEVEAARAGELASQAALERERSTHKRLTAQIARCKVTAPARGRVAYPTPLGAGAVVHDGQVLLRITAGEPSTKAK
jgi:HlyD family secretion protein